MKFFALKNAKLRDNRKLYVTRVARSLSLCLSGLSTLVFSHTTFDPPSELSPLYLISPICRSI
jgi:hypothetical protein